MYDKDSYGFPLFSGKQIDGIWHTGIVVYGKEFFFGGMGGIECCAPVSSPCTDKLCSLLQI